MTVSLHVLGSGSGGNATLVESDGAGLLIDAGLGPRQIASRLKSVGRTWADIHAVALTHTHGDHWREKTLQKLASDGVPFYCARPHGSRLRHRSAAFRKLEQDALVRYFRPNAETLLLDRWKLLPIPVSHDGGPTYGFRIEREPSLFGGGWRVGYLCDLGTWTDRHLELMRSVEVLALEFNHDVDMTWNSGRPKRLIDRCLGSEGHLSNDQAARFVRELLTRFDSVRLRNLVQLHLSRQCNTPEIARESAEEIIRAADAETTVHTADQFTPIAIG